MWSADRGVQLLGQLDVRHWNSLDWSGNSPKLTEMDPDGDVVDAAFFLGGIFRGT